MSHLHAMGRFIGEELLAEQQGRRPQRLGNRHPHFVPQGVFPCEGQDRWLALSVRDDAEWAAFVEALDATDLAGPHFATAAGRRAREGEIETQIAALTRRRDDAELARELQRRGVPAGAIVDGPRVLADMHLHERGFFRHVVHPDVGDTTISGPLWRFRAELPIRRPAPLLGQHTDEVLGEVLGLQEDRLRELRETGVTNADVPLGVSMSEA
jgi:benzylsuccinate CoA-transferase BbsF subunit